MTADVPFSPHRDADCLVVGASAGGVEALGQLLGALPAGFRAPVVIVLHLPPGRASMIAELMQRLCALPVCEALDKQPLAAGTVVFAPPDYHLLIEPDRSLALSVDAPVLYSRPAIDPLFESASSVYERRLLAILLTGASEDGSAGIAAVRQRGGQAWIQLPSDAKVPTMPAAALASAGADAVLTLDQMCRLLAHPAP